LSGRLKKKKRVISLSLSLSRARPPTLSASLSTRGAFLDKSFNYGATGQVGKHGRDATQPSETSFRRLGTAALSDL